MNKLNCLVGLILCCSLTGLAQLNRKTTIFAVGDVTMASKDTTGNNPERGWCQILPSFFDQRSILIDNRAKDDQSTESFINQGLWQKVLDDVKKGDYVFIQFGHNDSKEDMTHKTNTRTTYRQNLDRFITDTRQKGAIPILFTSIARRMFDEQGNPVNTLGDYPALTRKLGKELHVPVIDLNKSTENLLRLSGVEGSKGFYMHIEQGISKKEPYGRTDNENLNLLGACKVAELAIQEMKDQKLPIADFIKDGVKINTNFRGAIDRKALVGRHNVIVNRMDSLASLTVGNGDFAFTVDATGLQTFPEIYENGIPLGTQSQWGWHSFPNTENFRLDESFQNYNFRGRPEPYAVQLRTPERGKEAGNYFRANAHRLHLGTIGLKITKKDGSEITAKDISEIGEVLDLWKGEIRSSFKVEGEPIEVITYCHPDQDLVSSKITSPLIKAGRLKVKFRFPYPTGNHSDAACDWKDLEKHTTSLTSVDDHSVIFGRKLDSTTYFAKVDWKGTAKMEEKQQHSFELIPKENSFEFSCKYSKETNKSALPDFYLTKMNSQAKWSYFWSRGGAVDFSGSTDSRAAELERRAILSQYLLAAQCAGTVPPQETGLTYNSWYGKFHLEMHWWHAAHFALWNRIDLLEKSLGWYNDVLPIAQDIAKRQGFKGARWMKMTDPTGLESPSGVGSFLIWQQPHIIYFAELCYRSYHNREILEKYKKLVFESAEFMASFATYDADKNRYNLIGIIPAQESLNPEVTYNSPYELAYWHWGLSTAQQWRERLGMERNKQWDDIIEKISVLAQRDGLYLAAESAPNSYTYLPYFSDHPAVLGALGFMPTSRLVDKKIMNPTFDYIMDHWNWKKTWGWDFPFVAMTAVRLERPEKAIDALFMNVQTNTYLQNGHNYQDQRLRLYLPGNGGVLATLAMMCAGYDGCETVNPGFPKNGSWDVKWEGLSKMP